MIFWEICLALQLSKYIFMPATAISLDGKKVFSVKWMALVYIFYILQWFGFQPKWLNKSTCFGNLPTQIYNTGLTAHWFYSKTVTEVDCVLHSGVSSHATGHDYWKLGKQEITSPSSGFNSEGLILIWQFSFLTNDQTSFREANVLPLKNSWLHLILVSYKTKEHLIPCYAMLWEEDFYPTTHYKATVIKPMKIQLKLVYLQCLLQKRLDVMTTIITLSNYYTVYERQKGVRDKEPGTTWSLVGIQASPLST